MVQLFCFRLLVSLLALYFCFDQFPFHFLALDTSALYVMLCVTIGRLDKLKEAIEASGGLIPLAMIKNGKTVDPQDDTSTKVLTR